MNNFTEVIESGVRSFGITLPAQTLLMFDTYHSFLAKQNLKMNLTTITGAEEAARLHFLDSLALLNAANFKDARVIDIGSGAGFPGLPLKLAQPSISLTLLDATAKRIAFLAELCTHLRLEDVTALHARAEEIAQMPDFRDSYDIAVSRAVARLNTLCELCLPFVKPGGLFLAMKAIDSDLEISEAVNAIQTLNAELLPHFDYVIPETDIVHRIIVIRKLSSTPAAYPRRYSKIQNTPL